MKKRLGAINLTDIRKLCRRYKHNCNHCPLIELVCNCNFNLYSKKDLDKEVLL